MRHFYSVFAACVVSLLLFSLMQFLVSGSGAGLLKVPSGYTMQFIRLERHSSTQLKQRQLPKKPDPPQKSPAKPVSVHEHVGHDALAKPLLSMPGIPTMAFNNQPFLGGFDNTAVDSELTPLIRVEPNYPRNAARAGTEGWVEVQFIVLEDGTVSAEKVIKAVPPRIFNRSALNAIAKWKFNPKILDGKPVRQSATQVIYFKLAKP